MSPGEVYGKAVEFFASPMSRREGYIVLAAAVLGLWYISNNNVDRWLDATDQTFASNRAAIAEHHDRIQALETTAGRAAAP